MMARGAMNAARLFLRDIREIAQYSRDIDPARYRASSPICVL